MPPTIIGIEEDKLNPRNFGGMVSREVPFSIKADKEIDFEKGIETIATTEQPAIVVDWERWEIVREVLPMKYVDLPKNDKVVLLDSHSRVSTEKVLGSAKNWRAEGVNLLCKTFVSETEEKIRTKIKEEHLDSVSIGYQTESSKTVEIPKGAEVTIDGVVYKNEFEDDLPFLVRTYWKIKELSLVPIGADDAAKFRAEAQGKINATDKDLEKKLNDILNNQKSLEEKFNSITLKGGHQMPEPTKTPEQEKQENNNKILDFGKQRFEGRFKDLSITAVMEGKSYNEFMIQVNDEIEKTRGAFETPHSHLDMSEKEMKQYNLAKAIDHLIAVKKGEAKFNEKENLAIEAHSALVKKMGTPKKGDLYIPFDMALKNYADKYNAKAHSAGTPSEGGYLVATDLRGDLLVEVLRNELALGQLGATIIPGLRENFTIPRVVSGLTAYSVAENNAATKSYITVGQLNASPKHVSAYTEYGRQLFAQSSLSVSDMLIRELNEAKNVKVDYLGINGSGAGNEPTGLLNTSGISAPSLATFSYKNVLGVKKTVKKANAYRQSMKWLGSADVEVEAQSTPKVTGQAIFLMDEAGKMAGHESVISNQVGDQILAFGDWPQMYLLFWGADELLINPYAQGSAGIVELNIFSMFDTLFRRTECFAIADDVTIS